tara:strand:- start:74 stop:718 length:645 start_codon:yes stop_codon:yes gene_type:complete
MTFSNSKNTDTEELKKKGNFASDYDIDCKRHYRFEAGQNNSSGTISYRVLTNHGSSHGFYKKGKLENNILTATGTSAEFLGENIERPRESAQESFIPAKLVHCKNGDVMFDIEQGDFIVNADNIILKAKGDRKTSDGDIRIEAQKAIRIDADDIRITADNLNMFASDKFSLQGKVFGGIIAGTLNLVSQSDFGASVQLESYLELKKLLEMKRGT